MAEAQSVIVANQRYCGATEHHAFNHDTRIQINDVSIICNTLGIEPTTVKTWTYNGSKATYVAIVHNGIEFFALEDYQDADT